MSPYYFQYLSMISPAIKEINKYKKDYEAGLIDKYIENNKRTLRTHLSFILYFIFMALIQQ